MSSVRFLTVAIVLVLVSGLSLLLGPSSTHHTALQAHKVAFYVALLLIVAHVALHLPQAVRLVALDRVKHRGAALLVRARWMPVLGSVLLGAPSRARARGTRGTVSAHYYGR